MGSRDDDGDEAIGALAELETAFWRMITGLLRFIFVQIPTWVYELFQHFFDWLVRAAHYAVRFLFRLVRVAVVASVWAGLVFGPVAASFLVPSLKSPVIQVTGASWTCIGLMGSLWSLMRWRHQRAAMAGQQKTSLREGCAAWLLAVVISLSIAAIGVMIWMIIQPMR